MAMKRYLRIFVLTLLPILVACGSSKSDDDETAQDKKKPLPICPQVAIIHELDTLRDYGTEKPDPSQLVAVARLQMVNGDCEYKKDGIDIAFDLDMIAARGPRLGGNRSEFPFFLAVVDPDQDVLNKDVLTTKFKFGDDSKSVEKTENLHVFIPLPKQKRDKGPLYQVLIGFQLTQLQLDAIRDKETLGALSEKPPTHNSENMFLDNNDLERKSPDPAPEPSHDNDTIKFVPGAAPTFLDQEIKEPNSSSNINHSSDSIDANSHQEMKLREEKLPDQ